MKILSIGEIIFDIYGENAVIGGAPLNFCAHCSLLGADSMLISAVGRDEYGKTAIKELKRFGVNASLVKINDIETGKCLVTTDENAVPTYNVIRPAAYDNIVIDKTDIEKINAFSADVFAFGTLIQREAGSREALKRILSECEFNEIFCDINLRKNCYDEKSCILCLENATILKISDEEEPLLAEYNLYEKRNDAREIIKAISTAFSKIKIILFTMGDKGSLIYDRETDKILEFKALPVKEVSTVGAGDSYSAAFIDEYLRSGEIEKAGLAGARLSAEVVSVREAIPVRRKSPELFPNDN